MNKSVMSKTLTLILNIPVDVDNEEVIGFLNMAAIEGALEEKLLVDWHWVQEEGVTGRPVTPIRLGNNNPWEVSA